MRYLSNLLSRPETHKSHPNQKTANRKLNTNLIMARDAMI
jgi:hypothetical protein